MYYNNFFLLNLLDYIVVTLNGVLYFHLRAMLNKKQARRENKKLIQTWQLYAYVLYGETCF